MGKETESDPSVFQIVILSSREGVRYPCPCCGFRTLPARGQDDIRKVYFWQDDGQDDPNADEVWGGPNKLLSLTQARENYKIYGASDPKWLKYVRPPLPDER